MASFFVGDFEEGDFSDFDVDSNMLIATDYKFGNYGGDTNKALNSYVQKNITKRALGTAIYASCWYMLVERSWVHGIISLIAHTGLVDMAQASVTDDVSWDNPKWYLKYCYWTNSTPNYGNVNTNVEVIEGVWYYIEIAVLIDDGDGWAKMWVNGSLVASITGIDNYQPIAEDSRIDKIRWGAFQANGATQYCDVRIDDCEASESYIGESVSAGEIKIGSTTIDRIIEFSFGDTVDFAVKPILGKNTPTIEKSYITFPQVYKITARVTKTERDTLQTEKDNHTTLTFVFDETLIDRVKFEEFNAVWAGQEEHTDDWLVTLTLVSTLY